MNLTRLQQKVYDSVRSLHREGHRVTAVKVAAAAGMARRTVGMHLTNLKKKGLIVYFPTLGEWSLPAPEQPEMPDTWNMSRAAAFGVTVRVVEDAPITGKLQQVGFDYDFLWPRHQTFHIDWQTDLNRAVRFAVREVIERTAKGMKIPYLEAELYLVRHAAVRRERRESEVAA